MAFGGSGQSAGLLEGDVVMEVNGQNVEEKYLEDVIMLVKERGQFISLLVMEKNGYNRLKQTETPTQDISDSKVNNFYLHLLCWYVYQFISVHNI